MALAHKGLPFEPVPWRGVEKDRIARSGGETVPVLVDGDRWIGESWDIAIHLETAYAERPSLFGSDDNRAKIRLVDGWCTQTLQPILARAVLVDQFPLLAEEDQAFYQERTLRKYGKTLQELCATPEAAIAELGPALAPLEQALNESKFLGGRKPDYGDYVVFGAFQWARVTTTKRVLPDGSCVAAWFARLLEAFDGFAASQPARGHWS